MLPLYDPMLVQPMRDELTSVGVKELLTPEQVDTAFAQPGTTLVFVNSVCGCAAGGARPALRLALKNDVLPDNVFTVFAGQDREATWPQRGTNGALKVFKGAYGDVCDDEVE